MASTGKKRAVSSRKSWKAEAETQALEVQKLTRLLAERDELLGKDSSEIKELNAKVASLEEELKRQKDITANKDKTIDRWMLDYSRMSNMRFELQMRLSELEELVRQLRKIGQVFAGMSLSADASFVEVLNEFNKRLKILGIRGIRSGLIEQVVKGGQRQISKIVFDSLDDPRGADQKETEIMNELAKLIGGNLRF